MVIYVAKYLELSNDKTVVIDDQYNVPMLIAKGRVSVVSANKLKPIKDHSDWRHNYARYEYNGYTYEQINSINSLDMAGAVTATEIEARLAILTQRLIAVVRCVNGTYAAVVTADFSYNSTTKRVFLNVEGQSEFNGAVLEYAVYITNGLNPTSETLAIFNEAGKLLFDVRRPAMLTIGSLYGDLNVWNYEAGNFNITKPADIPFTDCFITSKSGAPFYSALRFHSGGITAESTPYKAVMTSPNSTTINVKVIRAINISASSNGYGYGGFFENLVYCPYPIGVYV